MNNSQRKFLRQGIAFLLLFSSIFLGINAFYLHGLRSQQEIYTQRMQWDVFKTELPDNMLKFAIFGDSHARDGIDAAALEDSWNFASSGESYIETYYRIKRLYEEDGILIDTAVLEIQLHTFSDQMRPSGSFFRSAEYYKDFVPLADMSRLTQSSIPALLTKIHFPIIGNGIQLIAYCRSLIEPSDEQVDGIANNMSLMEIYRRHFAFEPNLLEETSVEYFLKTLAYLQDRGANIIFVMYPVSEKYDAAIQEYSLNREKHYRELFPIIDAVTNEYVVLDYYDTFFENSEYFSNLDHLNETGALLISEKFLNE